MATDDHIPVADTMRAALDVAVSRAPGRLVLAVSGGRDSMALMHAVARWFPQSVAAVATFDHGSGAAATDAAALVAAEARKLGLTVIRERARAVQPTEDAWRTARWLFLKRVARGYRASVATAHTRDDQVETIVLRLLRGAGARGIAALAAPSTIVRPWLPLTRKEVASWATAEGVPFVDDPTNHTRQYFRSRVRLDLLPALELAHPGFAEEMLKLGDQAAALRRDVEVLLAGFGVDAAPVGAPPGSLRFPIEKMYGFSNAALAVVWPALMARCGVALNHRGTQALVYFSTHARVGTRQELAGGSSVIRLRVGDAEYFELRAGREDGPAPFAVARGAASPRAGVQSALPERFPGWRFVRCAAGDAVEDVGQNLWKICLPNDLKCEVRFWRAADRIFTQGAPAGRRVARYLSEARVPPVDRPLWPVVLVGEDIVWVPGVCRSRAAPNRPGRPDVTWYRCEREHG